MGDLYARTALYLQALLGNLGVSGSAPPYVSSSSPGWIGTTPAADYGTKAGTYAQPVVMKSYLWAQAVLLYPQLVAGTITQKQFDNALGKQPGVVNPNIHFYFRAYG